MILILVGHNSKRLGYYPVPDVPGKLVINTIFDLKITIERIEPKKEVIDE